MTRSGPPMTMVSSVNVANTVLALAFERDVRLTYRTLLAAVQDADRMHREGTGGRWLFYDEGASNLAGKLATVNLDAQVRQYVPFAAGDAAMLRLDRGSAADRAVRAAYGIHIA